MKFASMIDFRTVKTCYKWYCTRFHSFACSSMKWVCKRTPKHCFITPLFDKVTLVVDDQHRGQFWQKGSPGQNVKPCPLYFCIHCPQKVLGHLFQWEFHGKHQTQNATSRQLNVIGCWNCAWLQAIRHFKRWHCHLKHKTIKYTYIYCVT